MQLDERFVVIQICFLAYNSSLAVSIWSYLIVVCSIHLYICILNFVCYVFCKIFYRFRFVNWLVERQFNRCLYNVHTHFASFWSSESCFKFVVQVSYCRKKIKTNLNKQTFPMKIVTPLMTFLLFRSDSINAMSWNRCVIGPKSDFYLVWSSLSICANEKLSYS